MAALWGTAAFTPVSKGLGGALSLGCLAAWAFPSLQARLGIVAAMALTRPYQFLTCAFVGDVFPGLVYAVAALFLTRIVEPLHGARELLKYLAATIALSSFATVVCVTAWYYATLSKEKGGAKADHAGDVLFRPLGGFEAGIAALLVALKQQIPDNEVALFGGALRFRAKHLPVAYVVGACTAAALLGGAIRVVPFTLCGTYFAWAYLRFVESRNGVRGDLSDEFRLATFFPQPLQPPIDRLAAACTRLTGLGDTAGSQQHQAAWRSALVGGAALPGSIADTGDAARRRERGAKALEERLGLKKAASAGSSGALEAGGGGAAPVAALAPVATAPAARKSPGVKSPPKPAEPDLESGAAQVAAEEE